jgi:hypothetical protein
MFYWNARKSFFRWRGARGQCPCQNPSDSGEPLRTGCEAVIGWSRPARFRRVCPLLVRNDGGAWVCSVAAKEVRPFWGRMLGYFGGAALALALVGGIGVFGFMRTVGYPVHVRQVFWPPAWPELKTVRAQLFIEQAQRFYAAGRTRDAMLALGVAQELDPRHYEVGMSLAQFYQAAGSPLVDDSYSRLLREHPERRSETARTWFRSLLLRGRLEQVAALARLQLESDGPDTTAWLNALIFSAQKREQPDWLAEKAPVVTASAAAKAVLALAEKVQRSTDRAERRDWLVQTPLVDNFPYDRVYRANQLIRDGYALEATSLVGISRGQLSGSDIARLTLATYAAAGNRAQLRLEFSSFLAPDRKLTAAELELLALHLVTYPDSELLQWVAAAKDRLDNEPIGPRVQALLTMFCAAGVQQDRALMDDLKIKVKAILGIELNALNRLQGFFMRDGSESHLERLLPGLYPLSLELNYALLNRY